MKDFFTLFTTSYYYKNKKFNILNSGTVECDNDGLIRKFSKEQSHSLEDVKAEIKNYVSKSSDTLQIVSVPEGILADIFIISKLNSRIGYGIKIKSIRDIVGDNNTKNNYIGLYNWDKKNLILFGFFPLNNTIGFHDLYDDIKNNNLNLYFGNQHYNMLNLTPEFFDLTYNEYLLYPDIILSSGSNSDIVLGLFFNRNKLP